jgi:hypothetical protein
VLAVVGVAATARAEPDAGPPPGDAATDAASPDATPPDWRAERRATLTARLAKLEAITRTVETLKPETVTPPEPARKAGVDYADPRQVESLVARVVEQGRGVAGRLEEQRARLALVEPQLRKAIKLLERYEKRRSRYPRLKIPERVRAPGEEARARLSLMSLEVRVLEAETALLRAQAGYLTRSQPARVEQDKKSAERNSQDRLAVEQEREAAMADGERAERARRQALERLRRARTAAERLLASERARLEEISGRQAKLRQQLADDRRALSKLRNRLNTFRGTVSGELDRLKERWPQSAPRYDPLYDGVVAELIKLRPKAVDDLKTAIRGVADPPSPGERLSAGVTRLDETYADEVKRRERQRARLAAEAGRLAEAQQSLLDQRLEVLQREITGLNDLRIAILARVSPDKRSSLMGPSRETVSQLSREVTQLIFDALYWAYRRLHQIDQVPKLIIDVFTVGSVLWNTLKIIFLLLLLRFVLRRWDGWMERAMHRVGRSLSLGGWALRVAKLTDILRHSGPALLVLIVASLVYHMLGGTSAAVELRMVYIVFFWVAVYRLQLRVVESLARYTGMERALRAADEEIFEEDDLQSGVWRHEVQPDEAGAESPAPRERGTEPEAKERVVPASVLLVRSVRASTRYILAVVLVLELTGLAVGEGTIYGLTARFSWWAALPFVLYFLHLWRPHVERTYHQRFAADGQETTLERLVRRSEGKLRGVLVIGAVVLVLFGHRLTGFARRYLSSRDATKRLLAFIFRRRVEKHAQELGRVVTKRQDLPAGILEQFPVGPLSENGQVALRQPALDTLGEVFARWQEDQTNGSVALVGHTGMGKSTVLYNLERELGATVLRGDLHTKVTRPARVVAWLGEVFGISPRPSSEKELIKLIREDKRPAVAIDNCHNLFLRRVGGFEAWETFIRVVNETCDNVFWTLAFNAVAWEYLENIAGGTRFFRRIIEMSGWSEREIRRLIMRRMRRAGYGVSFTDLLVAGVEGVNISAQLGRTSEGYFRLLWDFTGGNPRLATHYWLDSLVVPQDGERQVRVHLFSMPALAALEGLNDDLVFVLTSVALHQNLTADEAARTTNLTRDFCQFAFRYCQEHGYLVRDPDTGRYRLSVRWQRPIQRFLKRKHLLYDV